MAGSVLIAHKALSDSDVAAEASRNARSPPSSRAIRCRSSIGQCALSDRSRWSTGRSSRRIFGFAETGQFSLAYDIGTRLDRRHRLGARRAAVPARRARRGTEHGSARAQANRWRKTWRSCSLSWRRRRRACGSFCRASNMLIVPERISRAVRASISRLMLPGLYLFRPDEFSPSTPSSRSRRRPCR